jgi:hypothetical protein
MRDGGRYKGLAELPTLEHIDVRREIAAIAGVGARNVAKVKFILTEAHPHLLLALREGSVTINRGCKLCKLPKAQQVEAFTQLIEEREVDKVIRQTVPSKRSPNDYPDAARLLEALQQEESRRPGSVLVSRTRSGTLVIIVNRDVPESITSQRELSI